jgi:Plasmid replication region DNA-binding N-term
MTSTNSTNNSPETPVQPELSLKEKVFLACDNMQAENKKITRESVRKITGGSDRDLSQFIKEWKESKALTVQNQSSTIDNVPTENPDIPQGDSSYLDESADDFSKVARRGAERAAAILAGEEAVIAHLLQNPHLLPEDLKQQVQKYQSKTNTLVSEKQQQYEPDFFAQAVISQFQ